MFDTLLYANKLKEAGFTDKQAEVIVSTQAELINEQFVTRQYLDLRLAEVRRDIAETKTDIVKWCVGSVFASVGLFAALVKLMG